MKTITFNISVINNQNEFPIDIEEINIVAEKMIAYIAEDAELKESSVLEIVDLSEYAVAADIVFCDNEEIEKLNASFRDKNCPTDVLSFALFADNPDVRFTADRQIALGEVIISAETAKTQATENNKTFNEEIYFLLSHGLLHLLGYDHLDEGTLDDMLAFQQEMTIFALK